MKHQKVTYCQLLKKNLKKAPLKRKNINKSPIENDSSSNDKCVKEGNDSVSNF